MMETRTRGKGTIDRGLRGSMGTLDDMNPTRLSKRSQAVPLQAALTNFRHLYSNAKSIFVLVRENSKKTLRKYSSLFPTSEVWPWIILSLL